MRLKKKELFLDRGLSPWYKKLTCFSGFIVFPQWKEGGFRQYVVRRKSEVV
jgi:hypothetical protein